MGASHSDAAPLIIFSGLDMGITALRIARDGATWQPEQVWHNADLSMYLSSPVHDGQLLYGFSHQKMGPYFCLEARSDKIMWASPGRQSDNAAVVNAGDQLLLFNTEAPLVIADKGDAGFAVRYRYTAAQSSTWAHPAVLDGRLLVKDTTHLYLWSTE